MKNTELLLQAADHFERFPERHNQGEWFRPAAMAFGPVYELAEGVPTEDDLCGTVCCIAGLLVALSPDWDICISGRRASPQRVERGERFGPSRSALWREAGAEILGLNEADAARLFDGSWRPLAGLSLPEALRLLARGTSVSAVSA